MSSSNIEVTRLIQDANSGDPTDARRAVDEIFRLLLPDLAAIASQKKRNYLSNQSLANTAALVNELYLRWADNFPVVANRKVFFVVAAKAVQYLIIDYKRHKRAKRRDEGSHEQIDDQTHANPQGADIDDEQLAIALDELCGKNERQHTVVMLKYYGGQTEAAIAETLNVDERTVRRDWKAAREFLYARMKELPS